jgi:hypothetical protein
MVAAVGDVVQQLAEVGAQLAHGDDLCHGDSVRDCVHACDRRR